MIINLTQHPATPEQIAAGVVDMPAPQREELIKLLTFEEVIYPPELRERAEAIADLADRTFPKAEDAMIGGAPFLMAPLEDALRKRDIFPMYAFSARVSVEDVQPDGSTIKRSVFRHLGFVEAA